MSLFGGADVNITNESDNLVNDIVVNRCEYGTSVPDVCGTTKVSPNIINYQDITSTKHVTTSSSGGKGGGGESTITSITYTYNVFLELALSEGPISDIGRVWINSELEHEKDDYGGTIGLPLEYKLGSQNTANEYMLTKHPTDAQVYPGLAYAFGYVYLGSSTTIPQYQFEVKGNLLSTGDGIDVNPADYIVYVMNKIGIDTTNIDGLVDYRKYCAQADLLISTPMDQGATEAQKIINRVLELTNAFMFWSNDRFKIVIREDRKYGNWAPNLTVKYALDDDDFLLQSDGATVSYERKPISEIYNRFTVNFPERANEYETTSISYEDVDDINAYGLKQAPSEDVEWFYTKKRALHYLDMVARNNYYGRNKYTFKLAWSYALLEPGDIVTLTDDCLGLSALPARVISVTEEADGTIKVCAVSMPPLSNVNPTYTVEGLDYNYVDFNVDADNTDEPMFYMPPKALVDSPTGHQFYIALRGIKHDQNDEQWGGCNVWAALNDAPDKKKFEFVETFNGESIYGTLATACSASATDIEIAVNGVLASSFESLQNAGFNYVAIGDEVVSFREVDTNENTYTLKNCKRGQLKTTAKAHSVSEKVLRLDGNYVKVDIATNQLNKEYKFKVPAFNNFGNALQSIASVTEYSFTPGGKTFAGLSGVSAYTEQPVAEQEIYNMTIVWDVPDWEGYTGAKLYVKGADNTYSYVETGYNTAHIANVTLDAEYVFKLVAEDGYGDLQTLAAARAYSYIATVGSMDADDIVDKINNEATTTVNGDKITANSITANQLDANCVTANKIQAGAVGAEKLSASLITLTNSQGVQGGNVTLDASGLNCALTNGSKVQFNSSGMSFVDSKGTTFSQLARFKSGSCKHGDYITLNWDVVPSAVMIFPLSVQTMVQGYTSTNLYIRAYPTDVTANGFTANVFTALGSQTYSDCSWSPISTLSVGKLSDGSTQRNYYTNWSTISGILTGETEIDFNVGCHLYMSGGYENPMMGYAIFLEVQQSTDNGSNWSQIVYTKLYQNNKRYSPVDEDYYPDTTFTITNGAQVRFRYKWEIYWTWDHDLSTNATHSISHSSNSAIKARVGSEYALSEGTAHYLALG